MIAKTVKWLAVASLCVGCGSFNPFAAGDGPAEPGQPAQSRAAAPTSDDDPEPTGSIADTGAWQLPPDAGAPSDDSNPEPSEDVDDDQ